MGARNGSQGRALGCSLQVSRLAGKVRRDQARPGDERKPQRWAVLCEAGPEEGA